MRVSDPSTDVNPAPARTDGRGLASIIAAYGMWGLFPIYFSALAPAGAWEILAHRIVWSLVTCAIALGVRRDVGWIRQVLRQPRLLLGITVAAYVIATNWGLYVWVVRAGHTTDAALGYFLNPLVTVALGVLVLRERLRPLQWTAVGIGVVAAGYLTIAAGGMPWPSLGLALSFAGYGLLKKRLGVSLSAWQSLAGETAALVPAALIMLAVLSHRHETTFTGHGGWHMVLLIVSGVVTAVPLLLFAVAAQRIPLVLIGLIQFMTPVMQLLVGVVLEHEHMSHARWLGFGIVWIALVVMVVDSLLAFRRDAASRRAVRD